MARDGQQGPRRYEFSISLANSSPVKKAADTWEMRVIATVLRGTLAPRPSRNVVLVVNGHQMGGAVLTDEQSGDACFPVLLLHELGEYTLKAYVTDFVSIQTVKYITVEDREPTEEERQLAELFRQAESALVRKKLTEATPDTEVGDAKRQAELARQAAEKAKAQADEAEARQRVRKAEEREVKPKAQAPTELRVHASPEGPAQKYYVTAITVGENQVVGNVTLEITDPGHPSEEKRVELAKTGAEDGIYRFTVETERPREISILAVGTPLKPAVLRLPGPIRGELLPSPEVPEPTATDLQGSPWDIIKRASQKGRDDLEKQRQGGGTNA